MRKAYPSDISKKAMRDDKRRIRELPQKDTAARRRFIRNTVCGSVYSQGRLYVASITARLTRLQFGILLLQHMLEKE